MTTITATTELEAVNSMLEAIGAEPVNTLSASEDSDVAHAKSILSEVTREVLSQGWDFNTDREYALPRTVGGEYLVPPNVLDIDISDSLPNLRGVFRDGKLWDQTNHTFVWTVALKFDIAWLFPFDELPPTARHYIAMKAARKFQARMLGSSTLERYTSADEADAFNIFKDAEALSGDFNILTGNYSVYRALNRWV